MTTSTGIEIAPTLTRAGEEWRSYDEFAAGIDTYRLPSASLDGESLTLRFDGDGQIALRFGADTVTWTSDELLSATEGSTDPYDAVEVRPGVWFVHLPLATRSREAISLVWSHHTGRAIVVHSVIGETAIEGQPQVQQQFRAGVVEGVSPTGAVPGPSRDLIGKRNVYRYSPEHLYEHVYLSSERYAWQCLQGVQRGHGDTDLSTVWKFDDGLYLFCFREFQISVASVWLHDLGYALRTTGAFLGLNARGESEHSFAGGHVYPLGAIVYPDVEPV